MNIAVAIERFAPGGGTEAHAANVLAGLAADGDTLSAAAEEICAGWPAGVSVSVEKIPTPAWLPRWVRKRAFVNRATRWLAAQKNSGALTLTFDRRLAGADVVFCGGTLLGYLRSGGARWKLDNGYELRRERLAYQSARRVVACSWLIRRELLELYDLPPERVAVLWPPVDGQRFNTSLQPRRAELRKKFGFADGERVLLFPSGGHKRKGLPLLVDAVRRLARGKFFIVVAGSRPPRHASEFVRHVGFVEKIEELYTAADAVVMPSRYEPFGLVYAEAWLCGTPVVVPESTAGAEEIFPPSATRLCSFDAVSLSSAILQTVGAPVTVSGDFAERHNLTVSGYARALRKILEEL